MARKLPPTTSEEIIKRRDELFESLSKESDRGAVLISASFLNEALEALLRAKFLMRHTKSNSSVNPLFNNFGPLNSFSAKIKICYVTDLIGEWVYRDLEIVRNLRNNFAHSFETIRFDLPDVVKLTEKLKAADIAVTQMNKEDSRKKKHKKSKKDKQTKKTKSNSYKAIMERARFEMSVSFIGALLYILTRVLKSEAPTQNKEKFIERLLQAK